MLWAIESIIENERLRDLVRYCRHQLHEEGLITDEEFVAMAEVGVESVGRLENYDAMLAQIEELHAELKEAKAGRLRFCRFCHQDFHIDDFTTKCL